MLTLFITMFHSLASILFPTLARKTSKHSHFNLFNVCVINASDTEFRLFLALGNKMDKASLAICTSK